MEIDDPYRGPWPDTRGLIVGELSRYLAAADDTATHGLPTRCPPWTVHQLTAHLAATFERFNRMLVQGRSGDLRQPFARDALGQENLRAVRDFVGDPLQRLGAEAMSFVGTATDPAEVLPHQFGPIPVGLQLLFGLNELAIHHDDVERASGTSYRPGDEVIDVLTAMRPQMLGGLSAGDDPWDRILAASGRTGGG